jgi:hypothetical protein
VGVGAIFIVICSRLDTGSIRFWLGMGLSVAFLIAGITLAPRKNLQLWAPAATTAGLIYLLYNVTISDWEKLIIAAVLILLGLLLSPSNNK